MQLLGQLHQVKQLMTMVSAIANLAPFAELVQPSEVGLLSAGLPHWDCLKRQPAISDI
jgi:hypothetical protein